MSGQDISPMAWTCGRQVSEAMGERPGQTFAPCITPIKNLKSFFYKVRRWWQVVVGGGGSWHVVAGGGKKRMGKIVN